jgi:GntR family transcriptional regulator
MHNQSISWKLHRDLEHLIDSGVAGQKLPSEPELSQQLGVSRATLREAMRTFEIQGRIRRRQGSGTFITSTPQVIESGLEVLESIQTIANRIGLEVKLGKWKAECRPPTVEEYEKLEIEPGGVVTDVSRVIIAEDRPAAFLRDVLPTSTLLPEDVEHNFHGSVLDLLLERGTPQLSKARTDINAVNASADIARALGIQRGDSLLYFCADLYEPSGKIVDQSRSYFLPGYFNFHVVRRIGHDLK